MTMYELKDCQCCGCPGQEQVIASIMGGIGYQIGCKDRHDDHGSLIARCCGLLTAFYSTAEEAIAAWNRRASPWKPIGEAICDDRNVLVYLDNKQTCGQCVFNFDHDSDPHYWLTKHGITHFAELPDDPP